MHALDIGLSALRTQQQQLTTLGNNIANASTPGYHRQRAELVARPGTQLGNHVVGSGVDVATIRRLRDFATEDALLRNESLVGLVDTELSVAEDIERLFIPGEDSVHARLSDFFNRLEALSNNPEEPTVRGEFLNVAESLVEEFNQIDSELYRLGQQIQDEAALATREVNQLIEGITKFNERIYYERAVGREPNDLLDGRDQMVTNLSKWLDVDVQTQENGRDIVYLSAGAITITGTAQDKQIAIKPDSNGNLQVIRDSDQAIIPVSSGKLRGLLDATNETIPAVRETFRTFTTELIRNVDQQHAQGLPSDGPREIFRGTRSVGDVNTPLTNTDTAFPIVSGELTYTITNPSNGDQDTYRISIDPAVDSLNDIVNRLNSTGGISALLDPQTRTVSLAGMSGQLIDFSGRPENFPDLSGISGTFRPEFSGLWTGDTNGQLDVTFSGAGDIGSTPGLTATVRDQTGNTVATLQVGEGYEAGTALPILNGVSVAFASGTVGAADTFSTLTTADADTTGFLSALGINSLFTGADPGTYALNAEIVADPALLSVSRTGRAGDALNIASLARLRDVSHGALLDRTYVESLADLTAGAGLDVQHARNQQEQLTAFGDRLRIDRDSVSGVDPNEELLKMLEVERAFQAAARFVSVIDETIDVLINMAR
jgi:flagellar hook-associated protein 1 FlgK